MEKASDRPIQIVDRAELLGSALGILKGSSRLGVDTESNGFYSYFERVCLIQISTADMDFIFDPLSLPQMQGLGEIFASSAIQKIFHGADYDIVSLKRDFHFQFANVFDTVVACKLLEGQEVALSKLLFRYFGIELDKTLQRSDWGKRPLSAKQLQYGVMDSRHLIALADILHADLQERELLAQASELFSKLCERQWKTTAYDPDGYRRIKGYNGLDYHSKRVLKLLYELRDRWAQKLDRPLFKVLGNQSLLHLATQRPSTAETLSRLRGFPKRADAQMVADVLAVLELPRAVENPSQPEQRKNRRRRRKSRSGKLLKNNSNPG